MFVHLTHANTGEQLRIRAGKIHTIINRGDKTLAIMDTARGKGMYVLETPDYVEDEVRRIEQHPATTLTMEEMKDQVIRAEQ